MGRPTEKTDKVKELSPQHDRFCREYIIDENAVRAYQRSYPNSGYNAAAVSAHELLKKTKIAARIEELRDERNKRLEVSADRVLAELAKLAFYNPRDLFDDDGRLKPITEMDPDSSAVIAGIETRHEITEKGDDKTADITVLTKIKLSDKGVNLERLGRHLKLFTDKVDHSGTLTFGDLVAGSYKEDDSNTGQN